MILILILILILSLIPRIRVMLLMHLIFGDNDGTDSGIWPQPSLVSAFKDCHSSWLKSKPDTSGVDKCVISQGVFDFDVAPRISPSTTHTTNNNEQQQQQQQVNRKTLVSQSLSSSARATASSSFSSSSSMNTPLFRVTRKVKSSRSMSPEVALGDY